MSPYQNIALRARLVGILTHALLNSLVSPEAYTQLIQESHAPVLEKTDIDKTLLKLLTTQMDQMHLDNLQTYVRVFQQLNTPNETESSILNICQGEVLYRTLIDPEIRNKDTQVTSVSQQTLSYAIQQVLKYAPERFDEHLDAMKLLLQHENVTEEQKDHLQNCALTHAKTVLTDTTTEAKDLVKALDGINSLASLLSADQQAKVQKIKQAYINKLLDIAVDEKLSEILQQAKQPETTPETSIYKEIASAAQVEALIFFTEFTSAYKKFTTRKMDKAAEQLNKEEIELLLTFNSNKARMLNMLSTSDLKEQIQGMSLTINEEKSLQLKKIKLGLSRIWAQAQKLRPHFRAKKASSAKLKSIQATTRGLSTTASGKSTNANSSENPGAIPGPGLHSQR